MSPTSIRPPARRPPRSPRHCGDGGVGFCSSEGCSPRTTCQPAAARLSHGQPSRITTTRLILRRAGGLAQPDGVGEPSTPRPLLGISVHPVVSVSVREPANERRESQPVAQQHRYPISANTSDRTGCATAIPHTGRATPTARRGGRFRYNLDCIPRTVNWGSSIRQSGEHAGTATSGPPAGVKPTALAAPSRTRQISSRTRSPDRQHRCWMTRPAVQGVGHAGGRADRGGDGVKEVKLLLPAGPGWLLRSCRYANANSGVPVSVETPRTQGTN